MPSSRITRREALRRTVLFSTAALATGGKSILRAAPAETTFESGGLHLLALGDYGTRGDANQTAVARAMATFAKSLDQPLTGVLAMGDNFYKKITPDRFENHFEKMYSTDGLDCPFYVCAGNHDYGTAHYDSQHDKLQMQLDYAKNNPHSRWKFPAKWYTLELPNSNKPLVKIIVLDGDYWEGRSRRKKKSPNDTSSKPSSGNQPPPRGSGLSTTSRSSAMAMATATTKRSFANGDRSSRRTPSHSA